MDKNARHIAEENSSAIGTETVIRIRNLYKSFDDTPVLNGVDLDLKKGENLVVLGRSGTGKSVLIKCIVELITPDAGEIEVLGKDVRRLNSEQINALRRDVGFSFQLSALYDSMTVRENLEFPLKRNLKIFDQKILNEKVMNALEEVSMEHAVDQWPADLSGGQKKRIGIARTLILNPKIMLYDEPTAGLDPITSEEINELVLEVQKRHGTSSIIITHDLTCARAIANRVIFLYNGKNHFDGPFDELTQTQDPLLKTFLNYYNIEAR
ncbi:ABC transporter ATP-binding protein [Nafulsella turpanensis]|uniref:ABC transporter ATP-binding protein n=1 Tax=Nafulsella turpanensis TaxID=1265690 RepID=UPI000349F564|nr:ATP-binding cassette domain-containing protein [Nafulsella turpanensis]